MIGIFDYTVILTYMSLISAVLGIGVSFYGEGHPYWGAIFLLICGLCDTFDGKVARTKKNRTQMEKDFGVQIDSLSDLVAFGVLPACIGIGLYVRDGYETHITGERAATTLMGIPMWVLVGIGAIFTLCALIRLAYFNVTVEETQGSKAKGEKFYYGLPVTSSALIFPTFLIIRYFGFFKNTFASVLYFALLIIVAMLFVLKFKLKKPSNKAIYIMLAIGIVEFVFLLLT